MCKHEIINQIKQYYYSIQGRKAGSINVGFCRQCNNLVASIRNAWEVLFVLPEGAAIVNKDFDKLTPTTPTAEEAINGQA